jgi:hypothetical protein
MSMGPPGMVRRNLRHAVPTPRHRIVAIALVRSATSPLSKAIASVGLSGSRSGRTGARGGVAA